MTRQQRAEAVLAQLRGVTAQKKQLIWISWDRTKVSHAIPSTTDYRVGSFPLACGAWAPDAWNVGSLYPSSKRRCRRCMRAVT